MQFEDLNQQDDKFTPLQIEALIIAWTLLKQDLISHSRNIFAKFYDKYPHYLHHFNNNPAMHNHTEKVLQIYTDLIDNGLRDLGYFKCTMLHVSQLHQTILNRSDIIKLNEIIKEYIFKLLAKQMTRTLREAVDTFLSYTESFFADQIDADGEEV